MQFGHDTFMAILGTNMKCNLCVFILLGLDQLLDENRISDLTLIYNLFSRVKDGLKELCSYFGAFIKVGLGSVLAQTFIIVVVFFTK